MVGHPAERRHFRRTIHGGCAESSTAARPSRRASSFRPSGSVSDRFSFEIGGFVADPEFSESFVTPDGDPVEEGWPMPDSPEEKLWAAFEYRVPGFLIQDGEFWTRFSYSLSGRVLEQPRRHPVRSIHLRRESGATARMTLRTPRTSSSRRGLPATLQFGVSSNNGWDAALIVRNLFDDDSAGYMSAVRLRRILRRSALPLPGYAAAAEDRQPVVHQAMVTCAGMG